MEVIGKISKGTVMDQIYIPKNRIGMSIGQQVVIMPLEEKFQRKQEFRPYYYHITKIEPLKLELVKNIFDILEKTSPENIIITGSFLENGFNFNDIDILLISNNKININPLESRIHSQTSIKAHIINITNNELIQGLNTDPLYQLMLSKCLSKNRLIYKIKNKPIYRILDMHLLKSAPLTNSYNFLTGKEKYYLLRNAIAIKLFIENKKLSSENLENQIKKELNINVEDIKDNNIDKSFYKLFKILYVKLQRKIINEAGNESK